MDGEDGIEQVRQPNPLRLRDQSEQRPVAIETPRSARFGDLESGFVGSIEQLVGRLTRCRLVGEFECFGSEPLRADNRDEYVWENPADGRARREVLELCHYECPVELSCRKGEYINRA